MINRTLEVPTLIAVIEHAFFGLIAEADTIADVLGIAGDRDEVVLLLSVAGSLVVGPVGIVVVLVHTLDDLRTCTPDILVVTERHVPGLGAVGGLLGRKVTAETIAHKLFAIHEIGHVGHGLPAIVAIIGDGGLRSCHSTLLGRNHHDAVGGTRTIDCGRGGVLQDVDFLDISRIEEVHVVANDTVDDVEWGRGIAEGRFTTDLDAHAVTCAARRLRDVDTRNLALQ